MLKNCIIFLAFAMALCLASCNGQSNSGDGDDTDGAYSNYEDNDGSSGFARANSPRSTIVILTAGGSEIVKVLLSKCRSAALNLRERLHAVSVTNSRHLGRTMWNVADVIAALLLLVLLRLDRGKQEEG